ncbi:uncharacterized protein LOC121413243 [Lytechinus variegatus]|uniref:uncharacterized protein LOC121413243 n=1 Tax=Lytechinus variegatus TaxID=7654 RepID=UPI001BB1FB08|nr:uncharacterized protein LOC121413243 [Lytechinus variegatus]
MYKLIFAIVALATLCSVSKSFQFTFTEGDIAELRFQYNIEGPLDFQLRIGDSEPFFQNGRKVANMLTQSQYKRFKIKMATSQSKSRFVQLQIQNISRTDIGDYICELVRDGNILEDTTQRFSVHIEYPPGLASCVISSIKKVHFGINDIWEIMNCSALTGTDPGYISCFQNNEQSPPWTIPISNQTHTLQKIWVRTTLPLVCCSSTYRLPKTLCECNDFSWGLDNRTVIDSCSHSSTTSFHKKSPIKREEYHTDEVTQSTNTMTYGTSETVGVKVEGDGKNMMISVGMIITSSVCFLVNIIFMLFCFQRVETRLSSELKDIRKSLEDVKKSS